MNTVILFCAPFFSKTERPRHNPERVPRQSVPSVAKMAQVRAKRRRARTETIDRLLEEIRAGREAMDTTFSLFLEQQRSFQNSLLKELRLARREQRRATEAELRARQEERQQQNTQQVQSANRTDAEIVHFRRELNLLRHTFVDLLAAAGLSPIAAQMRTPSPVPASRQNPSPSGSHWEGASPSASEMKTAVPLEVPPRGRRGRPRKRGGVTRN